MKRKSKTTTVPFSTLKKALVTDAKTKQALETGRKNAELGKWQRSAKEARVRSRRPEKLVKSAAAISTKLARLEKERRRIGREGMASLRRLDPEMAKFVKTLWGDPQHAVDWFTGEVESLGWRTPWQCIAEGERDEVQRILYAIAYGIPA